MLREDLSTMPARRNAAVAPPSKSLVVQLWDAANKTSKACCRKFWAGRISARKCSPDVEDDEEAFEEILPRLVAALRKRFARRAKLEKLVNNNLEAMVYGR